MKSQLLKARCGRIAALGMLLGIILLGAIPGHTQNFVKNPDFEYPLSSNDWTIVYAPAFVPPGINSSLIQPTNCGPNDFWIAGRSTWSHRDLSLGGAWDGAPDYWNKFGLHIAPNHTRMMHCYFKQVVTGLNPASSYDVSAWMAFYGGEFIYFIDDKTPKCSIFLEVIGGEGSLKTPYPRDTSWTNVLNLKPSSGGATTNWRKYSVTTTPNPAGEIEIRLHFNKFSGIAELREFKNCNAFYDHVSVVPAGQTEYQPPFSIASFTRTNQDITLTWQSVMNNSYRLQYSTNLSENPNSWAWIQWSPATDTNLYATGAVFSFKTNLASMFAFNPTFNSASPLFIRVRGRSFQP